MAINADKPHLWKADVETSIDFYNDWFLRFAPGTYSKQQVICTKEVLAAFEKTDNMETRQLAALKKWLVRRGYREITSEETSNVDAMSPGTFTFPLPISGKKNKTHINIPSHCIVKPFHFSVRYQPIVIEAKSTGNATSTNRRRKQEAQRFARLKERYGANVKFILLLCGHFDPFYLGHQAAEGIDWIWEHRMDDLSVYLVRGYKKRTTYEELISSRAGR